MAEVQNETARLGFSSSFRRSQASKAPAQIWLISFGDLLTLILGFFVAVVSQTPLNPSYKPAITQESLLQNSVEPGVGAPSKHSGTQLAKDSSKKKVFESLFVRFSERDFVKNNSALRKRAEYRLKKRVRQASYRLAALQVESCMQGLGSQSWVGSLGRTLLLRRQLLDAGVRARFLELKALGENCRHFGSEATKARLKLRIVHG